MEKPCENLCFRISAAAMQHTHRNTNSIQQKMYLCNGNLPVSAAPRAGAIPPGTALSRPHRTVLETPGRRGARLPAAHGLAPARRIAVDHSRRRSKARRAPCPDFTMSPPCNPRIYMYAQNTYGHGDTPTRHIYVFGFYVSAGARPPPVPAARRQCAYMCLAPVQP